MGITPSTSTSSLPDYSGSVSAEDRRASASGLGSGESMSAAPSRPSLPPGPTDSAARSGGAAATASVQPAVPTWRGDPDVASSTYGEGVFGSPPKRRGSTGGASGFEVGVAEHEYEYGADRWKRRKGEDKYIAFGGEGSGVGLTGFGLHRDGERVMDVSSLLSEGESSMQHPGQAHVPAHLQHHSHQPSPSPLPSQLLPPDMGAPTPMIIDPPSAKSTLSSSSTALSGHNQPLASQATSSSTLISYPRRHSISTSEVRSVPAYTHRHGYRHSFQIPNQQSNYSSGFASSPTAPYTYPKPPHPPPLDYAAPAFSNVPRMGDQNLSQRSFSTFDTGRDSQPHVPATAEPLSVPSGGGRGESGSGSGPAWEGGEHKRTWSERGELDDPGYGYGYMRDSTHGMGEGSGAGRGGVVVESRHMPMVDGASEETGGGIGILALGSQSTSKEPTRDLRPPRSHTASSAAATPRQLPAQSLDPQALLADLTATRALCAQLEEIIREKDEVIARLTDERDHGMWRTLAASPRSAGGKGGRGEGESGNRRSEERSLSREAEERTLSETTAGDGRGLGSSGSVSSVDMPTAGSAGMRTDE